MATYYLKHHGIRGQKWGVRRFQNSDGTWTEAGKKRYGKGNSYAKVRGDISNDPHDTEGSTKAEKARLAVNVALDLLTLNPVGAAMDITRAVQAGQAISKEKKAEKRLANAEVDEKTGLKLKSKELTAEQDMKLTNPGFHNFNTNTKNNCVLCSTAFELRRRGYDVIASKAAIGYSADEYTKWFKGAKEETFQPFESKLPNFPSIKRAKEMREWAESNILPQGEGARGYFTVAWSPYAGHSMAYEVKNNKIVIYDAQCGTKTSVRELSHQTVDMGFVRLDDKEPNWAAMKAAGVI